MSKDQLPDLLRQMVCRDNDELDIFWKAADEIERLREALKVSMKVMVRSHNRIHALPRATDTELADDIDRAIGTARAALATGGERE